MNTSQKHNLIYSPHAPYVPPTKREIEVDKKFESLELSIKSLKQELLKQCDSFAISIAFIMLSIIIATIIVIK